MSQFENSKSAGSYKTILLVSTALAVIAGFYILFQHSLAKPTSRNIQMVNQQIPGTASNSMSELSYSGPVQFCGYWRYLGSYGDTNYFNIRQGTSNKFIFTTCIKYQGIISLMPSMLDKGKDIILSLKGKKLVGVFGSYNFYATHGELYKYKITIEWKSENKILYSIYCSIRGGETERFEAIKVNN
jgi:hypothetical protein